MFAEVLHSIFIDVQSMSITTDFMHVQEFDFTTWNLWWTITSTAWTWWNTVWEWFYFRCSSSALAIITPPQSIFDNRTLKKVVLNYYLPNDFSSWWIVDSSGDNMFRYRYWRSTESYWDMRTYVWIAIPNHQYWPRVNINQNLTWEIELVINFDSSTVATWSVNWYNFTISSSYVWDFISSWTNKGLKVWIIDWSRNTNVYMRKATFYTK